MSISDGLKQRLKESRTFRRLQNYLVPLASANTALLRSHASSFDADGLVATAAEPDQQPEAGFVKNFIGVKQRPAIMPSLLEPMAGTVEGPPDPGNWHADIAEWGAAFHAVGEAGSTFRMIELGCGWGCWMVNTGTYARKLGKDVRLIGVEGNRPHLENARQTLEDNGFTGEQFELFNGIAAPSKGLALFPKADGFKEDWGGEAVFDPPEDEKKRLLDSGRYVALDCYTLADLADGQPLDLLHIDIQGAEVDFVTGNAEQIRKLVRRVLIGTHSRVIEGRLMAFFTEDGWKLEMDRPVISRIRQGRPINMIDGVQMWRNPSL